LTTPQKQSIIIIKSTKRGAEIMEYIKVTKENIEKEHICCAISNNKDIQVSSKKAWLNKRFLKLIQKGN